MIELVKPGPSSTSTLDSLLTISEVADFLQVARSTAYEMAAAGRIPTVRVGSLGKAIRVPREALTEWVRKNTVAA